MYDVNLCVTALNLSGIVYRMGASRHGQERALVLPCVLRHLTCLEWFTGWAPAGMGKNGHLPSLKNVRVNYNVLIRKKKNQNRCHVTRFTGSKMYINCECGRGSAPDPTGGAYSAPPVGSAPDRTGGVYSAPPDILAGFIGYAWQQRRKGRVDREVTREGRRRIKKQGEGWRGKGGRRLQLPLARIPAGAHRGYCKLCNCCHF